MACSCSEASKPRAIKQRPFQELRAGGHSTCSPETNDYGEGGGQGGSRPDCEQTRASASLLPSGSTGLIEEGKEAAPARSLTSRTGCLR